MSQNLLLAESSSEPLILIERQMNQNKKQVIHQQEDSIIAVPTCIQVPNFCSSEPKHPLSMSGIQHKRNNFE